MAASPRGSTRARGAAKGSPRGLASTTARMDGQSAMRGGEGEFGVERTVGASAGGADGASARHARDERKEGGVDDQTQAPSDVDDERIDGACDGFRLMSKAPPLTADMIDALNDVESRRVLARWSARMRSVKRRIEDCARQFPTSSLVLVFTKPFRSADNQRKWYVKRRRRVGRRRRDAPTIELTDSSFRIVLLFTRQGRGRIRRVRANRERRTRRRRRVARGAVGSASVETNGGGSHRV